jgi:Na+/phosphate symporter
MEKEAAKKMIRASQSLSEMLELAFQAFRKPTDEAISEAEEAKKEVQQSSSELTKFLIEKSGLPEDGKERVKPFLSVASSFDRMLYNIEGLLNQLRIMVRENIAFSDRAIKETNDVFQEAMALLEGLPNLIETQNKAEAQQMGEKIRSIFKIANGYSESHEERLMHGICLPKSSPIYLGVLESLKGIFVHILEISGKLVSLLSKAQNQALHP